MTTTTSRTVALPTGLIVQTGQPPRSSSRSILSTPTSPLASTSSPSSPPPSASTTPQYTGLPNALPPTTNTWLLRLGDLALYNPELLAIAIALFQHTLVFGTLFLLRAFSPKRALDLHYLTLIFALSFVALPLVFLFDRRIDEIKLLFFLEHEAVEYLIAVRVLASPRFVAQWSGAILLAAWCGLVAITIPVVLDGRFRHASDLVAWCAFVSDFLLGLSGIALVRRWALSRSRMMGFALRKLRAEAMAGLAFMCHGFVTMPVGPVFTLVLYRNLNPEYFAWMFVAVFLLKSKRGLQNGTNLLAISLWNPIWSNGITTSQSRTRLLDTTRHKLSASNHAHETRLPSEAWRVRLPEEHRSTAWTSVRPPHRRLPSQFT
ncbi:hypothetical protein NU219Hw_g5560t1 [Hortaea werneckii]